MTDKALVSRIKAICADSRNTYGYWRVHATLAHRNELWSPSKVLRLMRENKIYPKMRKKFKVTTDSKHNKAIHENRLSRQFKVQKPNQCRVYDININQLDSVDCIYLPSLILYSQKVVGWACQTV